MKKISVILFLVLLMQLTITHAITFVDALPGGKNYLDPENLTLDEISVETVAPFKIKGDTDYTLRFPGDMQIGLADVFVYGEQDSYLIGTIIDIEDCEPGQAYVTCTFHTDPLETHISLRIEARDVDLYHAYYGYTDYQLEEGLVATAYEPYIMPYQDTTDPEFSGSAAYIKSYDETKSLEDIISEHVVVYDEIDGDLSDSIVITSDPYTTSMHTVGTYTVGLSVTDQSNNTATFDFTIIINDTIDPIITGPATIDVSVDDMTPLSSILSTHYTATDEYDGLLSIDVISDTYTSSIDTVGTYTVTIRTLDSSGNSMMKDIDIHVVDVTAPTNNSDTDITVLMSNPQSLTNIVDNLVIHDNYSENSALIYTIYSDNYTDYENTRGTYPVELHITDESDNTLVINLSITVVDDVAPTITGPTSINTSYVAPYTMTDIISMLSVTDNHDGLLISDVQITQNNYENRSTLVGDFLIEFTLTDESSNTTVHQMTVNVVDDQNPVFYVDSHLISVSPEALFQPIDALNMLVSNGVVPAGEYEINVINDNYTDNSRIPGTYEYKLLFINRNGETYEHEFDITVATDIEESTSFNWIQLVRNIGVYSTMIIVVVFIVRKYKK